jgi:MFS family permease
MATASGGSASLGDTGPHQETGPNVGRTILVTATAALGGFLFGYDTAVINGAVNAVGDAFHPNAFVLGLAVAVALIGAAIGAWYAGGFADRYGRIRVMVIAAVLFLVSAVGSGLAFNIYDLAFWRLVGGMGVGAASVIAPAYIAEISPAHLRGRLGSPHRRWRSLRSRTTPRRGS